MGLPWPALWLRRLWVLVQVAVEVAVGKVLMTLFPERIKKSILAMGEKTGMTRNPRFSHDNWIPTFFSTQYFWFILKVRWQRLEETAELGGLAPDCSVVRLSGQKCTIWNFMQGQGAAPCLGAWCRISEGAGEVGWEFYDYSRCSFWGFRKLGILQDPVFLNSISAFSGTQTTSLPLCPLAPRIPFLP